MDKNLEIRDGLLDSVRGIAIILVVFGHCIQYSTPDFENSKMFAAIYSFHMPLFFMVSGYVLAMSGLKRPVPAILYSRAKNLLIPFFTWHILLGVIRNTYERMSLGAYLAQLVAAPDNGNWFLLALFDCFVAISPVLVCMRLAPRYGRHIAVLLMPLALYAVSAVPTSYAAIGFLKYYFAIFYLGFIVSLWSDPLKRCVPMAKEICLVAFPLLLPIWRRATPMVFEPYLLSHFPLWHSTGVTFFKYGVALFGCGFVFSAAEWLKNTGRVNRTLEVLGRYSLDIYVIHGFFVIFIIDTYVNFGLYLVNLTFATTVDICISVALSIFLLRRSKVLAFVFLGRGLEWRPARGKIRFRRAASA